uniref:mitogen-activated protein kinase kinase n=1 Tax=Acrobeloides nanus TaxID=290746 RepID=A0A914CBK6_9BILA
MASNISLPPIIFPNTEIPSFEEILEDEDVNNLVFPNDDMVYLFKMEDLSEASVIGSSMHVVKRYLHIPSGKIISEDLLGYTAVSILEALNVCKSKGIIHRDIKPENILIKKSGEIKLADFGESRFVDDSQKATTLGAGTIRYWPPERLYMERTKYDIRSDIWSFGLTLAEMAYGKYPIVHADGSDIDFQTVDLLMLQHQILEATADDIIDRCIRSKYSEDLCEFIWLCLQKLEDRANVEELVETDLYERHQVDAESAQETNILCLGPPNIGKTSAIKYFIHNLTRIANLDQEVLNFPDTINSIPVTYTCSKGNIKYRFIDMPGIANDNVNSFIEDKISTKKPQETTPTNSYEAADLADTTLASPIMTNFNEFACGFHRKDFFLLYK